MKLKELLDKRGINQSDLAKNIDISQKTISNYINEQTEPTLSVLIKIANYFDVSLDYLCERPFNKKETVKKLIELNNNEFEKADAYISAMLDLKKK